MSTMTQLILNGQVALPQTSWDKYRCYPSILNQQVEMISGRLVEEVRGIVQMIEYSYDYMGNDLMRSVLGILRSGTSFPVAYLPDEEGSRDTCILEADGSEGIYIAELDLKQLRDYRKSEVHGNAYRHPQKYGILIDTKVEEPFIREDYRR